MLSYGRLLVQFIRRLLVGRRRSLESRARLTSLNYVESVTENRDLWFVIGHVSHLLSFLEYSDHFASRSGGGKFLSLPSAPPFIILPAPYPIPPGPHPV